MKQLDLNADVGEGFPNDDALFEVVTSANVACGGHAGDERSMRETMRSARARGVAVGAHPSYPDREHFGRRTLARSPKDVHDDVVEQVLAFMKIAEEEGIEVTHVKPHGALYNESARNADIARAIAQAVRSIDRRLILVGLAGSVSIEAAREAGLIAVGEGFADRRYTAEGFLVSRDQPDAFVHDPDEALRQTLALAERGVQSICVHGDNPDALAFARALRNGLQREGVALATIRAR